MPGLGIKVAHHTYYCRELVRDSRLGLEVAVAHHAVSEFDLTGKVQKTKKTSMKKSWPHKAVE